MIDLLPPWRREKALKYSHRAGKAGCTAVFLLLQKALRMQNIFNGSLDFVYNEHGKPGLAGMPDVHFNLSHCGIAVACSTSRYPTGIDIETFREPKNGLLEYCCNEQERESIVTAPDPSIAFTVLWTRKESLFKMMGTGITHDVRDILSRLPEGYRFNTTINIKRGYVVSECTVP